MIYVVDASVWVSRLVPQDVYHPHSRRWLETQVARGVRMILPIWLLAEVAGAIARRTGEPALVLRSMDLLLRFPDVQWVIIDFSLGLEMARWSANLRLRGTDAAYVAIASRLKIPLVTWDREPMERAKEHISVMTPDA